MMTVELFPDEWKVSVTVTTPVVRDAHGKIISGGESTVVDGCLPAWNNSTDPQDLGDFTTDTGYLFPPSYDSQMFANGAKVEIPSNISGPEGTWYVDGSPRKWPLGMEVRLSKTGRSEG